MAIGPTTIYTVKHPRGYEARLRINDDVMRRAGAREVNYQKKVAMQFREQLKKSSGDPGWVEFDDLSFTQVGTVAGTPKRATAAQAAPYPSTVFDDVEEGGCGCACPGCDQMGFHCRKSDNGCKV